MVLTAVRGALGFLTRFPVGVGEAEWEAFRRTPAAFPAIGWFLGPVLAAPLVLPVGPPTAAALFLAWVYVCTGINHVDGVADLGDAMAVHGDAADRREVLADTTLGVGGVVAVGVVLVSLALAGFALASRNAEPLAVVAVVTGAAVGSKAGVAVVVSLSSATHEGLGSSLTSVTDRRSLVGVALVTLPAVALALLTPAAVVAVFAALTTAALVRAWARARLGGVSGDVFGATAELSRVVAIHAGVVTWTL